MKNLNFNENYQDTPGPIKWLENLVRLEKRYGFFNLVKGIFIMGACLLVGFAIIHPEALMNSIDAMRETAHREKVDYRMTVEPEIRAVLMNLRVKTDASRTYICEFHNGTSNLNGMPFLFMDMKYEDVADTVANVDFSYQNQPLSRYPFMTSLFQKGYWYGSVEEMAQIDRRLATNLRFNGTEWEAVIILVDDKQEIGLLGVSFPSIPDFEHQEIVGTEIRRAAIKLAMLLKNPK